MGEQLDSPNQQVVRPDGSGPADEGEGGAAPTSSSKKKTKKTDEPVTVDELETEGTTEEAVS